MTTVVLVKKGGAYAPSGTGGAKIKVGGTYVPALTAGLMIKAGGSYQNPVDPPHVPAAFSPGFSSGFA